MRRVCIPLEFFSEVHADHHGEEKFEREEKEVAESVPEVHQQSESSEVEFDGRASPPVPLLPVRLSFCNWGEVLKG